MLAYDVDSVNLVNYNLQSNVYKFCGPKREKEADVCLMVFGK